MCCSFKPIATTTSPIRFVLRGEVVHDGPVVDPEPFCQPTNVSWLSPFIERGRECAFEDLFLGVSVPRSAGVGGVGAARRATVTDGPGVRTSACQRQEGECCCHADAFHRDPSREGIDATPTRSTVALTGSTATSCRS